MYITLLSKRHGKIRVYFDAVDAEKIKARTWRITQVRPGGCKYAIASGTKKTIYMHRLLTGARPGEFVDHINRNTFDNRKKNLRLCTVQQNQRNRNKRPNTSSKYIGVSWNKAAQKWVAGIVGDDKKRMHLGSFVSEKAAALVYDAYARNLHGDFANVNFKNIKEVFA